METLRKYTTIFYSTHILEDVQRVSDTVAILNHGRMIAEAPIEELLNNNGSSLIYAVTLNGNTGPAQARVESQPWVQSLTTGEKDGLTTWQVSVTDGDSADDELLPLILEGREVLVKQYGLKTHNLEDVFLDIVGKESEK